MELQTQPCPYSADMYLTCVGGLITDEEVGGWGGKGTTLSKCQLAQVPGLQSLGR